MYSRRSTIAHASKLICSLCADSVIGQTLPSSASLGNKKLLTPAPACGFNRSNLSDATKLTLLKRCGVRELDVHIADERRVLDDLFWVKPEFGFYDDASAPNAIAIRVGDDGAQIGLGLNLLRDEVARHPNGWQSAVLGILAHEWAHAYQYSTNLVERPHLWETHADYLAGWYLGTKVSMGLYLINIEVFSDRLFRSGNAGFFDPEKYGSPITRAAAMRSGFAFGRSGFLYRNKPNLLEAVEAGYKFAYSASR